MQFPALGIDGYDSNEQKLIVRFFQSKDTLVKLKKTIDKGWGPRLWNLQSVGIEEKGKRRKKEEKGKKNNK